ncbi:MAG TPA: glycosyltransferase [Ktedonobacteraceae bacterium]|nr:glycosyltransferase [Ktedonobacteraceae bacterium]
MKILVVAPNLPCPTGGANTRNYHLLKALASEHTVSLLAFVNNVESEAQSEIAHLKDIAHSVHVIPQRMKTQRKRWQQLLNFIRGGSYLFDLHYSAQVQHALDALFAEEQFDAVLFESVFMAGYRVPQGIKILIDQHNIEQEILRRTCEYEKLSLRKLYSWREYHAVKRIELNYCHRAAIVLTVSERDRDILQELLPDQTIEVVPNGVDIDAFHPTTLDEELPEQIIFTGTMDYYPNANAALYFAQHCWPLIRERVPTATWLIVGKNPPLEVQRLAQLPGVTVTGTVPDIRSYLASSAVAIAPIQIGSGTRLKILEALAMQKAVVSTGIGCEGLPVIDGKDLLIADQPEAFAEAVVQLLQQPSLRSALGTRGRALVEAGYSWGSGGKTLLRILAQSERTYTCSSSNY